MKKEISTLLIVGGAVVVIGTLGYFLLRKNKNITNKPELKKPNTTDGLTDTPLQQGPSFELMGFVQKTNTPNVNILSNPTLFSSIVKKVESFTSIYARPSKNGFHEVSDDGTTIIGYVPNGMIRKL